MRAFFDARPALEPSPIRNLPALAGSLGIGSVRVKDETHRFGLNAFKLLGARFAIETLLAERTLRAGATVVCASEGNHGRAVARAARDAGCAARVYMAQDAAASRVDAIASEGAEVIKVSGSYDDAVRQVEAEARAHGWTIVSDTAWEGYERIPRLIMLGYTRMMEEDFRDPGSGIGEPPKDSASRLPNPGPRIPDPDVVFVQGGVGGLLCGVASWWAFHRRERRPRIVCVEPTSAACLQASARAGVPVTVTGPLNTTMAGLRNREVSPLAFHAVLPIVDVFMSIDDVWAHDAMKRLAHPLDADPAVRAGASGAAALGGLIALCHDDALQDARSALRLSPESRVLAIVSEGVTDPGLWRDI